MLKTLSLAIQDVHKFLSHLLASTKQNSNGHQNTHQAKEKSEGTLRKATSWKKTNH